MVRLFAILVLALVAVLPARATAAPLDQARPTLRRGSTGQYVREAQQRLNAWIARARPAGVTPLPVNGTFGPQTERTVIAFQRAHKVSQTGTIGPQTWSKLLQYGGAAAPAPARNCSPNYPDVCIPRYPPDLDCGDLPWVNIRVVGPWPDEHRLDRDRDGVGCES